MIADFFFNYFTMFVSSIVNNYRQVEESKMGVFERRSENFKIFQEKNRQD